MNAETVLGWIGCFAGMAGSLLIALKIRRSGWGFPLYLVSNAAWFGFGMTTAAAGYVPVLVQYTYFTVTSGIGVWRYLLQPWLRQARGRRYLCQLVTPEGEIVTVDFIAPHGASEDERDLAAFHALVAECRSVSCVRAGSRDEGEGVVVELRRCRG
ncbi:hypothetical protein [Eleftheria terrae]|uniref:hypothetical protein n=1 Tax=Eleftheria terrae TaxID=1597781 RepID=UPI00263A5F71|nr:hypothetical protein [Eleftheria terrae]WKB50567.1 hypothetical protein N7L95_00165 [Eleftheria terrae]